MVLASTTIVVTVGVGAIGDTQGQLDLERTEKAMTQLDSQAALVALGQSSSQQVDFSAGSGTNYIADDSAGRMTLSYVNQTDLSETEIFSKEMGKVYYETDSGTTIAYQGGGVWRSDRGGGTTMISPPEFHYRDATLTLPLVTIGTSGSIGSRAVVSNAHNTRYFPNESMNGNFTNPMENGRVRINVTSEYYQAWGKYFERRTDGEVEYDHPNSRVTLTLVTPLQNNRITSATSSLSASGSFAINGGTNVDCGPSVYTNSYNSSGTADDYCTQESAGATGNNGDVVYGGDIDISSGSGGDNIRGNVVSGNTVYTSNGGGKPYVYGNISYTTDCDGPCDSRITKPGAEVKQISGVKQAPAINGIIQTRAEEVESDNDNSATGNISSRQLNFGNAAPSDTVELHEGTYYLTDLVVPAGDTVLLNTTEGDITIVVEQNVKLDDNSKVKVIGDNSVSVSVVGQGAHTFDFYMGSSSVVTNDGDDAPQFRMIGQDNFTAQIGSGAGGNLAQYVGVIYAPPGRSGPGSVTLDGGEVYGGILTGTTAIDGGNGGSIHYDEALKSQPVLERGGSVVRVTYIHASVNEVSVTG